MNLVIFGASGRTGHHLIEQALQQNHTITEFARHPNKIQIKHERLRIVQGNIHNRDMVEQTIKNHDAVLCALGVNRIGVNHDQNGRGFGCQQKNLVDHSQWAGRD